jgi:hypothetical protein
VLPSHLSGLDWLEIESKIRTTILAELKPYSKVQHKEKGFRKTLEADHDNLLEKIEEL